MIHSLTIQRTTTYSIKLEAESREEAEALARIRIRDGAIPDTSEDWEFIHSGRTRHFVHEWKEPKW